MKKSSKIAWIFLAFAALAVFGGHNTSFAKVYTIKHSTKNVYTKKYQQEVTKKLSRMKKSSYTIEKPLLVKNPYGTLSTSIYFTPGRQKDIMQSTPLPLKEPLR